VLAREFLKHGGERAAIHHFEEDPQPIFKIKALEAPEDAFILLAHEHDSDFVDHTFALSGRLGLHKFESTNGVVFLSHNFENLGETADSNSLNNIVVLARVLFFHFKDFALFGDGFAWELSTLWHLTVRKWVAFIIIYALIRSNVRFLGLWTISGVESFCVPNYSLKYRERVGTNLLVSKLVDRVFKALGETFKFDCALLVYSHFDLEFFIVLVVNHEEVAGSFLNNSESTGLESSDDLLFIELTSDLDPFFFFDEGE
jgi:hypothetical protein